MLDECMLSSPLAAGQEWHRIIRQMHNVLAELPPSPTDSFLSPNHLQRPRCRNGAGEEPPTFLHGAGEGWDVAGHCTSALRFPTKYN